MGSLSSRLSTRGVTPVGGIIPSGAGSVPTGYLACDGAAVSRATYANLFAIISTTYGAGNGTTTFNVPNISGLFPRGAGSQSISSKTFNGGSVGNKQKDGTSQNGLSIATVSTPSLSVASTDLTHTHPYNDLTSNYTTSNGTTGSEDGNFTGYNPTNATEAETTGSALGNHSHTVTPSITSIVTTLSSSDTETKPAHITTAFYIKF